MKGNVLIRLVVLIAFVFALASCGGDGGSCAAFLYQKLGDLAINGTTLVLFGELGTILTSL